MPKLDGVSATSMIRQFDQMTPIISMTSNSKPADIMRYYACGECLVEFRTVGGGVLTSLDTGMNDILPKPFTKEGLSDMLDVCLFLPSFWNLADR
jgi:osomolarity two-component system response regulator SKN7